MNITRRTFLTVAAAAVVQPPPIELCVRGGGPARQGADLALDEMSRTALLLGGTLVTGCGRGAQIDVDSGTLTAGSSTVIVKASGAGRADALRRWRADRPGTDAAAAEEWHPSLVKFGAEQLNARFERRYESPMSPAAWIGWMLVKIAVDASLRAIPPHTGRYDGHKGAALYVGPDSHLVQPLCIVTGEGALLDLV
jgi:hypothetical protein